MWARGRGDALRPAGDMTEHVPPPPRLSPAPPLIQHPHSSSRRPNHPSHSHLIFSRPPPQQPKLLEAPELAQESATKVAAGSRHSLVLCASGAAFAFGWGELGQLGGGRFRSARTPQAVATPGRVTDLAAGWWHSLFVCDA